MDQINFSDGAERLCNPYWGELGTTFTRHGTGGELFHLREGRIFMNISWGETWQTNVKVRYTLCREDGVEDHYFVDTDPYDCGPESHKRKTRAIWIPTHSKSHGKTTCVKFSYILHFFEKSVCSKHEYILAIHSDISNNVEIKKQVALGDINNYKTYELDPHTLQEDVYWIQNHYNDLNVKPYFTKGRLNDHDHPKHYIHHHIDQVIQKKQKDPSSFRTIKVSVDDIDDKDFINHLIYAHQQGVFVQCIVDWRKMMLTNSQDYVNLKRSGIELLGVICTTTDKESKHIEVEPDMHTKFIIFDGEHAITASFNITFLLWGNNWETGVSFSSQATSRLLDNVFQSQRGGVIQKYVINPTSRFNIVYTFGRHKEHSIDSTNNYRPHNSIFGAIHNAKHSIKVVIFIIGDMLGDYGESLITALINAKNRGVNVQIILNGHVVRVGSNDKPYSMHDEVRRPVIPSVKHLQNAGIPVHLVYGQVNDAIPYSPLHSKFCVVDDHLIIDGSFNWYNTSKFSHDLVIEYKDHEIAKRYLEEFDQILSWFKVFK
eukprot:TRINITY_DN7279_c0_g1_i1.p1 TRINITY_DN7279_c0_g1~~TRINITY_DN7279_c0_g1_i1.p1  ORF type:complete len:544 (+),score=90.63 TRINITY_DN7279_c0_g1_i1:43-1674(+)